MLVDHIFITIFPFVWDFIFFCPRDVNVCCKSFTHELLK